MKYTIIFLLFLLCERVYPYDYKKCSSQGLGSLSFFGVSTSAGQFTSSTGGCSMIGQTAYDKKVFLVNNSDPLRIDISRGNGEYLDAYAIISGCDLKTREYLPVLLQKNYVEIWGEEEKETKAVYDSLEKIMNNDSKIKSGCSLKT
nr:hypothetical protein BHI3_19120 [Bacteriovorax sp. HI3]